MLFRPDGVGMLHVVTSDTVGRHDLLAYARDHSPPGTEFVEASCGSFRGFVGSRTENGTLWRTWWFLCRGQQLVYAGYECGAKNGQVESSEVEAIIQSFEIMTNPAHSLDGGGSSLLHVVRPWPAASDEHPSATGRG